MRRPETAEGATIKAKRERIFCGVSGEACDLCVGRTGRGHSAPQDLLPAVCACGNLLRWGGSSHSSFRYGADTSSSISHRQFSLICAVPGLLCSKQDCYHLKKKKKCVDNKQQQKEKREKKIEKNFKIYAFLKGYFLAITLPADHASILPTLWSPERQNISIIWSATPLCFEPGITIREPVQFPVVLFLAH